MMTVLLFGLESLFVVEKPCQCLSVPGPCLVHALSMLWKCQDIVQQASPKLNVLRHIAIQIGSE